MNHGGFIFSNADGNSRSFTRAIEKAAAAATDDQLKMHPLSPSNWLYHVQYQLPAKMDLMGLSNGIRVSWVHSPIDVGARWESLTTDFHRNAFRLAANVYFYATSKHRLVRHLNSRIPKLKITRKLRNIDVSFIRHAGEWNPEPEAFNAFAHYAALHGLRFSIHTATLKTMAEKKPLIAYMAAMNRFDPSWRTEHDIRNFLDAGGTLIIESPNANRKVTHSVRTMIAQLYPLATIGRIPQSSRIFNGSIPGTVALHKAAYRAFFLRHHGFLDKPVLYGLRRHGRWMILYSPYNIATGLTGAHAWGIMGYSPATARQLMLNMILYASQKRKP